MGIDFQYSRGHMVIHTDDGDIFYADDLSDYTDDRPCISCNRDAGPDDPDPCLGWLDGVDSACCGHGIAGEEYVLANGTLYDSVEAWREAQT